MLAIASELFDKLLNISTIQYDKLTRAQKKRTKVQNKPENLALDLYLDEDVLPPMPPLEGDEEDVKKRNIIKNVDSTQIFI